MGLIVLTTDLSPASAAAYQPTMKLAAQLGHRVVLLHVVVSVPVTPHGAPLAPPLQPPDVTEQLESARAAAAPVLAELGSDVELELVVGDDVPRAVAQYAEQHGADLIALSTHGRTGLRHLVLGSQAEGILRHAKVPVLSFPLKST